MSNINWYFNTNKGRIQYHFGTSAKPIQKYKKIAQNLYQRNYVPFYHLFVLSIINLSKGMITFNITCSFYKKNHPSYHVIQVKIYFIGNSLRVKTNLPGNSTYSDRRDPSTYKILTNWTMKLLYHSELPLYKGVTCRQWYLQVRLTFIM